MRFTSFLTRSLPLATLALAGSLMSGQAVPVIPAEAPITSAYSPFTEDQVSDVLRQVQSRAYQLSVDADVLQSYTHGSQLTWQAHASKLNAVRGHINAIGQHLRYLQNVHGASAPWQQQAINRLVPSAAMIADSTTAAIGLLNDNRRHISLPEYADHVQALYQQADQLKQSMNHFVELDKTQQKLEAIQNSLQLDEVGS
jgi:hypothetical protein